MERIGLYKQLTPFTNENAGTAEWCMAEKDGIKYFVKKFQSPVYPSKDLGLPEKKYQSRVVKFHAAEESRKAMYRALRENDTSGTLVVPVEVINYQYHICTIAEYIVGNVSSNEIYKLSEWQRLVLMRTLTLALINVHRAGVVHSDMKPDNVLITQNPENGSCALKLIDFDGSFMASNPPVDVTGDPAYFAPEAYAMSTTPGIRLDKRIDIFALGIIFHYFWTGKLPEKDSDQTIGQCILKGDSVKLDSSIPETLQTIIKQALEGNPDQRITGEQIYSDLEKILPSYPVKIVNLQSEKKKTATSGGNRSNLASSRERIEVSVDKEGNASEYPIRFTYEKDKKQNGLAKTVRWVAVLCVIYLVVVYAAVILSYNIGNYERAKEFLMYAPFFEIVFPTQYNITIEKTSSTQVTGSSNSNRGTPVSTKKPISSSTRKPSPTPEPFSQEVKPSGYTSQDFQTIEHGSVNSIFDDNINTFFCFAFLKSERTDGIPEITVYFPGSTVGGITIRNGRVNNGEANKNYSYKWYTRIVKMRVRIYQNDGYSDEFSINIKDVYSKDYQKIKFPKQYSNVTRIELYIWHNNGDTSGFVKGTGGNYYTCITDIKFYK